MTMEISDLKKSLACLSVMLLIGGCGTERDPAPAAGASDAATAQATTGGQAAETLDAQGMINRFSLRATGGVDATWNEGELSLSGGCTASSPMSVGFRSGLPTAEDYLYVGFDTMEAIAPGSTGTFAVKEIRWDHGTTVSGQPARPGARVPNRFSGTGSLSLTTHQAAVGRQRMIGTLTGQGLTNADGVSGDLVVEFDINRSCGLS